MDLLRDETHPGVRTVLGHFMFVYIHPYTDGNGRIARFLMNAMLASGNYPWTVIKLDKRDSYMKALETASVKSKITAFAKCIAEQVSETIARVSYFQMLTSLLLIFSFNASLSVTKAAISFCTFSALVFRILKAISEFSSGSTMGLE